MDVPFPLKKPLIFFDLETTGLDFKYDRIIEIAAIRVNVDGSQDRLKFRINPLMKIPIEVSQLTGIKNEDVAQEPTFADKALEIEEFFSGADVGGYNIARFDVKVMTEEFKRVGKNFDAESRSIIDSQSIFHQKERRDLAAAFKFYCEKELIGAHGAGPDTEATFEIFLAQLNRYSDLPKSIPELHQFCKGEQDRFVDGEGKFFWRDGEAVFNFGKYKSKPLKVVVQNDPEYLSWIMSPNQNFPQEVVDICFKALKGVYPTKIKK